MIKVNLKTIWVSVISGVLAHLLLQGKLQEYIVFQSELNEIAGFILLSTLTVLGLMVSVEKA